MLKIGNFIKKALSENAEINALTKGQVFPLLAPQGTTYPYAVYARTGMIVSSTKDDFISKDLITIFITSDDYDTSVNLGQKIENALVGSRCIVDDIRVYDVKINDSLETYTEVSGGIVYIQVLEFQIDNEKK